jgi:uncharacterized protein
MTNTRKPSWRAATRSLAACLLLGSLAVLPPLSHAGLKEGTAAYHKADYATALTELRPLAEIGHPAAQNLLGKMNHLGQGMAQNKKEAARWFHLAAEQGLAEAQSVLGYLCLVGEGVSQNNDLALEWTRKAAQQGDANAQFNLSVMHGEPHGIRKNPVESLKWLLSAAEQGHGAALDSLGRLFEQGKGGVSRHLASAYLLTAAAAEKGHQLAADRRKEMESKLPSRDLQQGREMLRKWRSGTPISRLL